MAGSAPPGGKKPSVLIVGGLGFIGRFLAKYIHENNLASTIRIVDKVLPQLAHLAPEFSEICSPSNFIQADASRETSMSRIFDHPAGPEATWDYVFNLGGESAWSQTTEVYKLRSYQLSITLGKEAAKREVKAFVEASMGSVYSANRTPRQESDKLKPWLKKAKVKLEAERDLSLLSGLNLVILRFGHVYGEYDSGLISKLLCLSRVFQEDQKEMKWLWTDELKVNTVHVEDAVRALWCAAEWRSENATISDDNLGSRKRTTLSKGDEGPSPGTPVFNIVDHGDTSQGTLANVINQTFSVKTGFHGALVSQFAKLNMDSVMDDMNEDTLQPWAEMLQRKNITHAGPLSPFLEKEMLKDCDLSLDGSLFERTTGFKYQRAPDGINVVEVQKMVESYKRMGWWP